jgi:hypothetical protein
MSSARLTYFVIAMCQVGLLTYAVMVLRRGRKVKVSDSVILVLVLCSLIYDNMMLAWGTSIGDGDLLKYLSVPRYVTHALLTPMLILFAALSAGRMNVDGYRSREKLTFWGAITFFAIWYGLFADGVTLQLVSVTEDGLLRYAAHHAGASPPPLAVMTTGISLIIIGASMQRFGRWPWLFVGAMAMMIAAIFWADSGVIANIGELMLLTSLVVTGHEAVRRTALERAARKEQALGARRTRTVDA